MRRICFLFDLDGTLVLTGGAGIRAFDRAFKEVFRKEGSIKEVSPAGKTDPAILRELCRTLLARDPTGEEETALFRCYVDFLKEDLLRRDGGYEVMPGIPELLGELNRIPGCHLGLGTGNIRDGAAAKLERSGLWDYFSFGGFGCDALKRPDLLAVAVERGRALLLPGQDFDAVYVIGDTPLDIEAGRSIRARTVGVATGPFSMELLKAARPDHCYVDFSDYKRFLSDLGL